MFYTLSIELQFLYTSEEVRTLTDKAISRFDSSFHKTLSLNIMDNMNNLFILLRDVPGANCYSAGVRIGASLKKMFMVTFD